jgi:hypothetical protein
LLAACLVESPSVFAQAPSSDPPPGASTAPSPAPAFNAGAGVTVAPAGVQAAGAVNGAGAPAPGWAAYPTVGSDTRVANRYELGGLYAAAAGYGVTLGVWIDAEFGIREAGVVLIPPTILGVAAPVTVRLLNRPTMPRGLPAAITTGITVGGGEALGLVGVQTTTSKNPWGFRGVTRTLMIGSTVGGAAGYWLGLDQLPSPNLSTFVTSGVVLGSAVGSMFGLGTTRRGESMKQSDGWLAGGALIGLNGGLVITGALSTVFVPSVNELRWLWLGSAIGAAVSLPAYLFYVGEGSPPAKRGLVFTGTTTLLGGIAGAVLGPDFAGDFSQSLFGRHAPQVSMVSPMPVPGGFGLMLQGSMQ